jgi:hypothetical protein
MVLAQLVVAVPFMVLAALMGNPLLLTLTALARVVVLALAVLAVA